jgi:hypothetical protein
VDGHNRIRAIVCAAEHFLGLGRFDFLAQFLETARHVCSDVLSRLCPFEEDVQIIASPLQRSQQGEVVFHPPAPLHDFLRLALVTPERRVGDRLFDVSELLVRACRLKDASEARGIVG